MLSVFNLLCSASGNYEKLRDRLELPYNSTINGFLEMTSERNICPRYRKLPRQVKDEYEKYDPVYRNREHWRPDIAHEAGGLPSALFHAILRYVFRRHSMCVIADEPRSTIRDGHQVACFNRHDRFENYDREILINEYSWPDSTDPELDPLYAFVRYTDDIEKSRFTLVGPEPKLQTDLQCLVARVYIGDPLESLDAIVELSLIHI